MKKKIYLVDVSSMYFRAFYAIRELTNSKGLPTNALYGFLSMTVKLMREEKPDLMVYCFDSREPSFRKEIYSEYKANRSEMPEALIPQVPYIRRITDELGIPALQLSGYEADDLIGTVACRARDAGCEVWIVSGDKDFAQLVGPSVGIYDTMKDFRFGVPEVIEKWGVKPELFVDYLALVGDSSDNIPGVKGIGPKGAQKLLNDFGSVEEIYARIEDVKNPGLKKKLEESREMAFVSKKLSQIHLDVPIEWDLDDGKLRPINVASARILLKELEFKSLELKLFGSEEANTVGQLNGQPEEVAKSSARTATASGSTVVRIITPPILNIPNHASLFFNAPVQQIPVGGPAPVPVSAPSQLTLNVAESKLPLHVGTLESFASITKGSNVWAATDKRGVLIATEQDIFFFDSQLNEVGRIADDKELRWSGWDLKAVFHTLQVDHRRPRHVSADLLLANYLVHSTEQSSFHDAYKQLYSIEAPEFPTPALWVELLKKFEHDVLARLAKASIEKLYREIELPLVDVLYAMERRGVQLDTEVLAKQALLLDEDVIRLEKEVIESVGEPFSLASPKQLSHILFEKLKMPVIRKTKTGYSTDSDVLEKLAVDYPICRKIIEYRELSKLKSTYVDSLPLLIDQADGRLHTTFNQTLTATGRLSSSRPNLQNIPIRTERGNAIRRAFVAKKGSAIISADYSQIELRLLAHITSDENMIRAFENDLDIHSATASEVFSVGLDDVTPDLRRVAKEVNFGIAYGISAFGLSENLHIPRGEAQEIIGRYFAKFPRIREYMDDTIEVAKRQGYVTTLFGRRRYLPELSSKHVAVKKFGERAAINAPIQGSAADIVKIAMVRSAVHPDLAPHMLLQVHDELIFEVRADDVRQAEEHIREIMVNVTKLKVPLKVSVQSGRSWFEAH